MDDEQQLGMMGMRSACVMYASGVWVWDVRSMHCCQVNVAIQQVRQRVSSLGYSSLSEVVSDKVQMPFTPKVQPRCLKVTDKATLFF